MASREVYEDDWWEKGLDYFNDTYIKEYWNFNRVTNRIQGDLLIFAVHSKIGNHCGIYLGQDMFMHHAVNRLSAREPLFPSWNKYIIGTYRYEKKS